jgi:hypothetical protein
MKRKKNENEIRVLNGEKVNITICQHIDRVLISECNKVYFECSSDNPDIKDAVVVFCPRELMRVYARYADRFYDAYVNEAELTAEEIRRN